MTQSRDFLETQLIEGTCEQLDNVNEYLNAVTGAVGYVGEGEKNGNEVMRFSDGSIIVRCCDEASDYNSEEDYR